LAPVRSTLGGGGNDFGLAFMFSLGSIQVCDRLFVYGNVEHSHSADGARLVRPVMNTGSGDDHLPAAE
jgi:hypothetical protein